MSHISSTLRLFSSQALRARMLIIAVGCILIFSGMARASLIPALVNGPVPVGPNFRFDYVIILSADERVDLAATNGNTCPGPTNSNVLCSPAGTFVTFYDVPGFVTAFSSSPDFSTTFSLTGPTPNSINGAAFDSPGVTNVTFSYTNAAVINGPATFSGFSIVTQANGINPVGNFTSQSTNNTASSTSGTSDQVIGSVPIPSGVTAATAMLGGKVLGENGRGIRGVRVMLIPTNGEESRMVVTDKFGQYSFADVEVGETYTIAVSGKNYFFSQSAQLQTLLDDAPNINFYAVSR